MSTQAVRPMYELVIDGFVRRKGSLVAMLAEARGCAGARIYHANGGMVVDRAGSDTGPLYYVPRQRFIVRRMTPWAQRAYLLRCPDTAVAARIAARAASRSVTA